MSKKSFASAPKPQRQPTAEEIERFEATGKPASVNTETQKPTDVGSHEPVITDTRAYENAESQETGNPGSQKPVATAMQEAGKPGTLKAANTEIQEDADPASVDPVVRLTIDLPENVHTRFKAACAATRRKMVQEVRTMIEQRTDELESVTRS